MQKNHKKELHEIRCGCCDFKINEVSNVKEIPKTIICPHCGVSGMPAKMERVSKGLKRIYPLEYWENQ